MVQFDGCVGGQKDGVGVTGEGADVREHRLADGFRAPTAKPLASNPSSSLPLRDSDPANLAIGRAEVQRDDVGGIVGGAECENAHFLKLEEA